MIDLGRVVSAPTLDELAKKLNMPAANLKKAVEDYNGVVAGTYKDPLGFVANNKADKQMTEGPWYACQKVPTVHHTMGGLKSIPRLRFLTPTVRLSRVSMLPVKPQAVSTVLTVWAATPLLTS